MIKKIICLAAALCMAAGFTALGSTDASSVINADTPFISYVESAGVRTVKIVNISGTLSHGLSERVAGVLKDSSGNIVDAAETDAQENGSFTLSFTLKENLPKGTYTITAAAKNCALPVTKTVELSALGSGAQLSSFSLGSQNATISGTNVSLTLSSYTNLAETVPAFSVSDGASVYVGTAQQTSGTSKVSFSGGAVTYRIVSEDLSTETSYTVTVSNPSSAGGDGGGSDSGNGGGGGGGGSYTIGTDKINEEKQIFSDLDGYEWAEEYIEELYKKGIVSGDGNGKFNPGGNVTREEFVKMIVLTFGIGGDADISFSDVPSNHWAHSYIKAAFASGIINGVSESAFGTGKSITRQDMAVIAYRAAMVSGKLKTVQGETAAFADSSDISEYAENAVNYMYACGIINGTGNNNFSPLNTATRGQAAKILCLMVQ